MKNLIGIILMCMCSYFCNGQNPIQVTSIKTLNTGWYTIAKNTGTRASAKFSVREAKSSYHSAVHFYAQHHYGNDQSNQINVLANSFYGSNGAIRYLRIVEGSTYAGAYLQVYIDVNSTTGCYAEISEDIQTGGWDMVDWQPSTMILPNGETGIVRLLIDLDVNNGAIISHDLWVGGMLEVNGTIRSKEIKVEAAPWPDYVFSPEYNLKSLEETEAYIKENNRLPDMPSAEEVAENGIALGEMNRLLLEKVEELTLYMIELNRSYQSELAQLKEEIEQLKTNKE